MTYKLVGDVPPDPQTMLPVVPMLAASSDGPMLARVGGSLWENERFFRVLERLFTKINAFQEKIRPCAKTSNTASAARPRMQWPVDQDLERSDPCAKT